MQRPAYAIAKTLMFSQDIDMLGSSPCFLLAVVAFIQVQHSVWSLDSLIDSEPKAKLIDLSEPCRQAK
ncbi:hypothetical protein WJX74_010708 [Apatococcus lobatus]|uniref:Uncharacterized protein n=1 Tax=Apatococcus lobatus TaxID=904363 RepID=A0AAW1QJB0_9CHLO